MGDTLQRFALALILVGGFLYVPEALQGSGWVLPIGLMLLGLVVILYDGILILLIPPEKQ